MYSLVSATGRIKGVNNPWETLDIGNTMMTNLFHNYEEVYVKLTNPLYPTQRVLKLTDIVNTYRNSTLTFNGMLAGLGNGSLPTVAGDTEVTSSFVRYRDAVKAGFKLESLGANLNQNPDIAEEDRMHIAITRDGATYSDIPKYCLAIVNGLIHRLDYNSQMAVIYNGYKHSRECGRFEVGLLSFKTVGEIKCVSITADMISRRHANTPLSNKLYITLPDTYPGYKPMLVYGGYLYPADARFFYNVSDKIYCLDTGKISLLARFMQAREFAGFDVPTLEVSPMNEHLVSVEQLLSDEKIIEVATALESFFVFVKTDNLYESREMIPRTRIPGSYKVPAANFERKPLIGGYGLFVNYWETYETQQYCLRTTLWGQVRYNFLTADDREQFAVDDIGYSGSPIRLTDCYFMTLGADKLTVKPL